MPTSVLFGKDGTLLTVDGTSFLGSFETLSGSIENTEVEHNGPQDEFNFSTMVRSKMTVQITGFEPATGGGTPLDMAKAKEQVALLCNNMVGGGRNLSATMNVQSASAETQTEPTKYNMTLVSYGEWTLS